jgi:dephospho-CoA kinase
MIPLLYEIGEGGGWESVICVSSPEAEQIRRLRQRGLTEEEARARMAAQMPVSEKMRRADYVIFNCGSRELLEEQARRTWRDIVET